MDALMTEHQFYAVINFAAESHVDRSINDPLNFIHTNVIGTSVLLDCARRHGVQRFIQVSTDEVYGSLGTTGKFTEQSLLDPSSPYSASKAGADLLAVACYKTYGQEVLVTRCSNNYGPYQFPEKLIPLMMPADSADSAYFVAGGAAPQAPPRTAESLPGDPTCRSRRWRGTHCCWRRRRPSSAPGRR